MPPTLRLEATNPTHIHQAAQILRNGGTVAFPTETVYGLGASCLDPKALEKIFEAKQRPHWDPLICHVADLGMLDIIATPGTRTARRLMDTFWPGPLTLLLPRTSNVPDIVTAGRPLVGVRMPAHPVALALIRAVGIPLAAPSANTFGHTSPTTAAHVLADLDGRIDAILDGGPTDIGLESTVVEVHPEPEQPDTLILYREGGISLEALEQIAGTGHVSRYTPRSDNPEPAAQPSPGIGLRHYAPSTPLLLVEVSDQHDLIHSLLDPSAELLSRGLRVGLLLPDGWGVLPGCCSFAWGPWQSPETLAQRLYGGLRDLETRPIDVILCPLPPGTGLAEAIRDRLQKAARQP